MMHNISKKIETSTHVCNKRSNVLSRTQEKIRDGVKVREILTHGCRYNKATDFATTHAARVVCVCVCVFV